MLRSPGPAQRYLAAARVLSKMFWGSMTPSPLPSLANARQVAGMNCIGPTARSNVGSPSSRPPSLSPMRATPTPLRTGPLIEGMAIPAAVIMLPPKRPWSDSTRPMAASTGHWR
ncbi:MAG TPA: hypothetical protein VFX33_00780 [Actinomycetales bacterium]|nr:hypothetical protein [Actinomycetales bacterium]